MYFILLQANVFEFVEAGVSGFILKDASIPEFLKTIRSVYQDSQVLPLHLTDSLFSQIVEHTKKGSKHSALEELVLMTKRERQIIVLIADGATNKEIT
jgi:DNA-binding NarL/FixJ family response regulator